MKSIKSTILPLRTILFSKVFIFVIFILVHVLLFNINSAEWGDSYRILRASNFIRNLSYPSDEKRPPLFSAILAVRPAQADPVVWGRGVMFAISLFYFWLFYSFAKNNLSDKKLLLTANILFIFNPVFLYWSIRIMSDTLFSFWVLLSFYWLYLWKKELELGRAILLGFISGLSVLTRFEGYLLFVSVFLGILMIGQRINKRFFSFKNIVNTVKSQGALLLSFSLSFILTVLPYLIISNPLKSSYLGEPSGRTYDLETVWIFAVSLIFILGIIPAVYFALQKKKLFFNYYQTYPGIFLFVFLELVLILLWPAAIPRLFLPIIPFLIIPLTLALGGYFSKNEKQGIWVLVINLCLALIYAVSQYFLKLQFLVPQKYWFIAIFILQALLIVFLYLKKLTLFVIAVLLGVLVWSMSPIFLHKDTYSSVKEAAVYAVNNLSGRVAYNDVSSVADWYLNNTGNPGIKGYYYNVESKKNLTQEKLLESGMDYILVTNEHNTSMTIDFEKRPYLEEIFKSEKLINGKIFFAEIVKVNKE